VKRRLAALALFSTAAAWGATFALVKDVIRQMTPESFLFWRFLAAGIILLVVALARRSLSRAMLGPGIVLGLLIFGAYWTQTRGLMTISPSRSAFLTGLYVVLVPFLQGKVSANGWTAAVLALAGTVVMVGGGAFSFTAGPGALGIGEMLTLACALFAAVHVVVAARTTTKETATGLAAIQVAFVAVAAAPFAAVAPAIRWSPSLVMAVLFTAVVTTALAFAALMWGQAHVTATEAAVILSFEPVAAALTSVAFYGEPVTATFIAGAVLILAAMLLSQL
jgi:drug/metabolite transporter (DMT)-like permease